MTFETFGDAYFALCASLNHNSQFISAPRDLKIKESLGVQFRVLNPRARLPFVRARKFSLPYFIAETLWYLSGNDKTAWIARYAPFWSTISDDGVHANSAYGSRIFTSTHSRIGPINQWEYVKRELFNDRDSRRAVIHIRTPQDSIVGSRDVPCTLSLQFFIRNELLHMHVSMRSSDIILGLPYDVAAFTLMQELLANELGVGLGEYVHTSNSLHVYQRHFTMLEDIVSELNGDKHDQIAMNAISDFPLEQLLAAESIISRSSGDLASINAELSSENPILADWSRALSIRELRRQGSHDVAENLIEGFHWSGYKFFMS